MDLKFKGITNPIRLHGKASDLLPVFRDLITSWPFLERAEHKSEPVIEIWKSDEGYNRQSPWLDCPRTYPDPVNATCDFIVDLVHSFNLDNPDVLCLHCAAVILDDEIALFPSGYNQGKSTFVTALASAGVKILCDDVMPLDIVAITGQALGIQPRLRRPIPSSMGAQFCTFVTSHAGPHSERFQYLKLGEDLLAMFGEVYPISSIVLLERNDDGVNTIDSASQADALKAIILRNFVESMPAADTLDGLATITDLTNLIRLNYSDTDKAVQLLRSAILGKQSPR